MEQCEHEELWDVMAGYVESWPCTNSTEETVEYYEVAESEWFRYALCAECQELIREHVLEYAPEDESLFRGLFSGERESRA